MVIIFGFQLPRQVSSSKWIELVSSKKIWKYFSRVEMCRDTFLHKKSNNFKEFELTHGPDDTPIFYGNTWKNSLETKPKLNKFICSKTKFIQTKWIVLKTELFREHILTLICLFFQKKENALVSLYFGFYFRSILYNIQFVCLIWSSACFFLFIWVVYLIFTDQFWAVKNCQHNFLSKNWRPCDIREVYCILFILSTFRS